MTQTTHVVVRKRIVVNAPIEQAFKVFTERFGDFKPRAGGHIYARGVDGSECRWARVLVYEPRTGWCSAGISVRPGS